MPSIDATTPKIRRRKIPRMARWGPKNGRWKGGTSKTFYRRACGCIRNDGKVVHHTNGKKTRYRKWRLPHNRKQVVILDRRGGVSAKAKHNKEHPEKGGFHLW